MRASLVGASTAMMTPLFPVIGLNYLVFRNLSVRLSTVLSANSCLPMARVVASYTEIVDVDIFLNEFKYIQRLI